MNARPAAIPLSDVDRTECLFLLLGMPPDEPIAARYSAAVLDDLVAEICTSVDFREQVLSPLLLREALPQEKIAAAPPFRLIDWVQRRLPLQPQTRRAMGAARSWTHLLELLLSDDRFLELAPDFREARIDECLLERVAQGPLAAAKRAVVGSLDSVSAFEIRGWAIDICDKSKPVTLEFFADHIFIGSVTCGEPRPDVQEVMGGDGSSGFHYRIATAHRLSLASGRTVSAVDAESKDRIGAPFQVPADPSTGWDLLRDARRELTEMRKTMERLEARLPDLTRLASLPLDAYGEYWERFYRLAPDLLHEQRTASERFEFRPLFSIVMPAWNTDAQHLVRAIDSVRGQSYVRWELIISDDASALRGGLLQCQRAYQDDARIRWLRADCREGIAVNTNRGIAAAAGDYVAFLDHDDEFAPDALFQVASRLQARRYGLIYSDEDRVEDDALGAAVHHTPFFKPGFDPDLLRSFNYICHLVVVRRDLVSALGGLRSGYEGAQDHDFLLRAVSRLAAEEVLHIARILYHWRVTPGSVSRRPADRSAIQQHIVAAVNAHLRDNGLAAEAHSHGDEFGSERPFATRVRWRLPEVPPDVAIIVPTRDRVDLLRPCVESVLQSAAHYPGEIGLVIVDNDSAEAATHAYFAALAGERRIRLLRYTGSFNWSAINNFAARACAQQILVFLNNDTIVRSPDWIGELASQALRADVGAVGARLLYADGTLQHAGVVLGVEGAAGHDSVGEAPQAGGYFGRSHVLRSAAAVTGACLATRRVIFEQVGGFDEHNLKVAFNDIDYCMKLRRAGYRIVYDPFAVLLHFESKSRGRELTEAQQRRHGAEAAAFRARWGDAVWEDPYYNAHFERYSRPFDRLRPPV